MDGISTEILIATAGAMMALISGSFIFTWQVYRSRSGRDATIFTRIDEIRNEKDEEIGNIIKQFHAYQLQVAKEYVSVEHLREVEQRLTVSIDTLTSAVKDLTRSFDRMDGADKAKK